MFKESDGLKARGDHSGAAILAALERMEVLLTEAVGLLKPKPSLRETVDRSFPREVTFIDVCDLDPLKQPRNETVAEFRKSIERAVFSHNFQQCIERYPANPLIEEAASERHESCCANQFCMLCGAHVSGYNCNPLLVSLRPEADQWDWWLACDNATCDHAYGEGLFQTVPAWVDESRRGHESEPGV